MLLLSFCGCRALTSVIDTDFYTGRFVKESNRSVEHILPKSKGGKNNIKNYAMSNKKINSERGNMPMQSWIKLHPNFLKNMKNYVLKYFNKNIDGIKHGEEVAKTVKEKYGIDLLA